MHLKVWAPSETLLEAHGVSSVRAQLADGGSIGIRPGHTPLLAVTVSAPLRYIDQAGEHSLELEGGLLRVESGGVVIFTSGLARHSAEAGASTGEPPESADDEHFGRLARALLRAGKGLGLDEEE
jgi:F0F1-type ATP synthase epsilon subunit